MKRIKILSVLSFLLFSSIFAFSQPRVPDYIVFAGDTVRLDRTDLRERMDRELLSFTYSHQNSLLILKRANKVFPEVEPLIKMNGLPDDLKYLMVIESNLDPKAASSAGAAGYWQIMAATARSYGLRVNSEVDERYNLEKATMAAAKYLLEAYEKYGDWMTVAASYNGGQNGISKRLADQHQGTAMNLWLVEETSRYMFRILAAKMFLENPQAFGFKLMAEDLYPYIPPVRTVTISGAISSLVQFADNNGVSYYDLKRANLWLRDSKLVNKERSTYHIAIPDVEAERRHNPKTTRVHNPAWVSMLPFIK